MNFTDVNTWLKLLERGPSVTEHYHGDRKWDYYVLIISDSMLCIIHMYAAELSKTVRHL